jgi:hypothetical protein
MSKRIASTRPRLVMNERMGVSGSAPFLLSLASGAMGGFVTSSGRLDGSREKSIEGQTMFAIARPTSDVQVLLYSLNDQIEGVARASTICGTLCDQIIHRVLADLTVLSSD